jgi:dsRNA-specific ribonuclease
MNARQIELLKEHLPDPDADINQKLGVFIKISNSDSSFHSLQSEKWNVSKEEWQRYEFLGEGTGKNATEAKQEAAKQVLEKIKKKP